ncbi:Acbp from Moniliophthora Perniciosa [Hysterangium stoloniferum]|nr:Acbp from Moniliophthora Perniciosa [Hysterangium stoloniferum]
MSSTKFDKAVEIVQGLPKEGPIQPSQDDKLYFYARYKQATIGDVNTNRPGMMDFVGKAKWDAWNGIKGKSKDDAMKEYVERLLEVLKKVDNEESKNHCAEIDAA